MVVRVPTNKKCFPLAVNGIVEDVAAAVLMGKVIRPLRSVDPSQTEYQGLIEVSEEGWCQVIVGLNGPFFFFLTYRFLGKKWDDFILFFVISGGAKGQNYPFGIMGMANKADCLQKGELVKFQVCTVAQTGQKMACNVVPQRRAMVECVKDQVMIIYSLWFYYCL